MPKREKTEQSGGATDKFEKLDGTVANFIISDISVGTSKKFPEKMNISFNFVSVNNINGGKGRVRFFKTANYIPPNNFESDRWLGSKLQRLLEIAGKETLVREILGDFDIETEEDCKELFKHFSDAVFSITVSLNEQGYPTVKRIDPPVAVSSERGKF